MQGFGTVCPHGTVNKRKVSLQAGNGVRDSQANDGVRNAAVGIVLSARLRGILAAGLAHPQNRGRTAQG